MIRFRHSEDERRYLALRSEIYRLAAALPPTAVTRVLRNLGKLEQLLHLEGVRQGLAIAEISNLASEHGHPHVRPLKAFQAHATIYGSTDSPLSAVEQEWLTKLAITEQESHAAASAWLDDAAMRYAPQTLTEWEGEDPPAPVFERLDDVMERVNRVPDAAESDASTVALDIPPVMEPRHDAEEESPSFLDEVRNHLQPLLSGGWNPDNWRDLILRLHLDMKVDAAFLDLQLSTDFGRAMLDQCGLYNLHPGHSIMLEELQSDEP